jgi:spermidine synthase
MTKTQRPISARAARALLASCFLVSGFTALLYQTVWMRLSLAKFGVNTSVVATVLAVFMLGLAAGSAGASRLVDRAGERFGIGPLRIYGLAELFVGLGGIAVPTLLTGGRQVLLAVGPASGLAYSAASTAILAAILLPFCTAMGLTFPSAIAFLKRAGAAGEGREPFSSLYLANVIGALVGAVLTPLLLIEYYGFLATCRGAAVLNVAIAAVALSSFPRGALAPVEDARRPEEPRASDAVSRVRLLALFATGFTTMGMEVLWMRLYPRIVGTMVYSFAAIVSVYLIATTLGSTLYRLARRRELAGRLGVWLPWLCAASLLPLLSASVTFPAINGIVRVLIGLVPFCALLGFLTPALVDREAGDDPAAVGRAYGINLLGCLLGPLVAGFVLLPTMGLRATAVALALPLGALCLTPAVRRDGPVASSLAALAACAGLLLGTTLFEEKFPAAQVRRDHVATVIAVGQGRDKSLLVNGVGMTALTTITKMMAHFPAAHLKRPEGRPLDALVICFGMGTTFRALASWGANVTAVELVPSVPKMFGYYFPEGPDMVKASSGRLRIIADDGRRFLDRSHDMFDLITIDPPPPVEAAGSGMLYSKEFYTSAKRRMRPGAILQTWLPTADRETVAGMTLSVLESFPYVRVMSAVDGTGYHVTASNDPIPHLTPDQLVGRMPPAALADMREWDQVPAADFFDYMLSHEYVTESLLIGRSREATLGISDDRPVNEFYFMRRLAARSRASATSGSTATPAADGRP